MPAEWHAGPGALSTIRSGQSWQETVIADTGRVEPAVSRDREVRCDPQLIANCRRRFPGFDDKIFPRNSRTVRFPAKISCPGAPPPAYDGPWLPMSL